MDSLDALRQAIEKVFQSWEDFTSGPLSRFRVVPVLDYQHDRYVLQDVDPTEDRFRSKTLAHLEIRDGKIWILTDNTEEGLATELVREGIPNQQIVLAFYPPSVREVGDFAVT